MADSEQTKKLDEIDARLDYLYGRFRKPEPHLPDRLFHYTDSYGLAGIVQSQKLWASNADFLNDSSEPSYALDVLRAAIDPIAQHPNLNGITREALVGFWESAMAQYKTQGPHVYVFCLSERDDLLSQWRSYGGQGAGYAIGLSGRRLSEILRGVQGQYLVKIAYDRLTQDHEADSVFQQIVWVVNEVEQRYGSVVDREQDAVAARLRSKLRTAFLAEIIRLRAKFKIPAFQEEGEWRVVQFVDPRVKTPEVHFRVGVEVIKPYLELELGKDNLPIEQVTIGPTLDPDLARQSLELLFAKRQYKNVRVIESAVPYRR